MKKKPLTKKYDSEITHIIKEYGYDDKNYFHQKFRVLNNEKKMHAHPEKCFVESTKISIDPYLN